MRDLETGVQSEMSEIRIEQPTNQMCKSKLVLSKKNIYYQTLKNGTALVDLGLPPTPHTPEEGFKVISELLTHSPTIKIHVLSGQNDEANVKRALTLGAVDFIAKPCDVDKLKDLLLNALKVQNVELNEVKVEQEHGGLLGDSLPMQVLRMQIV